MQSTILIKSYPKAIFQLRHCIDIHTLHTRLHQCTCLVDTGIDRDSPELSHVVNYLVSLSMMTKNKQMRIVIQWITYSGIVRQHTRRGKVFLLPGTSILICQQSLQRIIGYKAVARSNCSTHTHDHTIPVHGLRGRVGGNANRTIGVTNQLLILDEFFDRLLSFAQPRATQVVQLMTGEDEEQSSIFDEFRDADANIIELPPYHNFCTVQELG